MMASYDFFFKARRRGMPNGSMERSVSLKKVSCGGHDARARTTAQTCQREIAGGSACSQRVTLPIRKDQLSALQGDSIMATIKFLDPRVTLNPKNRPLVPGLDTLEGRVIGIIDNGQANSTAMFQELAQLIGEKFHTKEVLFKTKPTHMQGAPKPIMEEILNRCDAVITGLGA
jgi:hypothetical protein